MSLLTDQLRAICFFVDNIVYSLIARAYELIIYLANVDLFSDNDVIQELIGRVYLLLGIFMLFKISFSILQYLIDPNAFSDKSKGFGKLITNVMVSLVLLVTTPLIFQYAYKFQSLVITTNLINNLILGQQFDSIAVSSDANKTADNIKTLATDLQFAMFGAFYTVNTSGSGASIMECKPGDSGNGSTSNVFGSKNMAASKSCLEALSVAMNQDNYVVSRGVILNDFFKSIDANGDLVDNRHFGSFGALVSWRKGGGEEDYSINYTPVISTIAGGYLLLLLITFCIDVAARAIKLLFLQAIAPIAIISYIDPKESMSQGRLHNWIIECAKTYVSLFLRLAVVFLAIRLVQMISNEILFVSDGESIYYADIQPADGTINMFVYLFLILGVFTFAKRLPQMIEKVFNFKLSGELQLNPFKSIRENLGATALLGSAAALGATGIATGAYATNKIRNTNRNIGSLLDQYSKGAIGGADAARGIGRNMASAARGLFASAFQTARGTVMGGVAGARTGGKGGYFAAGTRQAGNAAWNLREMEESSFGDRMRNTFQERTGAPMDYYTNKTADESRKRVTDIVDAMRKKATDEANKAGGDYYNFDSARKVREVQTNLARIEEALKRGQATQGQVDATKAELNKRIAIFQNDLANAGAYDRDFRDLTSLNRTSSELPGFDGGVVNSMDRVKELSDAVKAATAEMANERRRVAGDSQYQDHGQRAKRSWRENQNR